MGIERLEVLFDYWGSVCEVMGYTFKPSGISERVSEAMDRVSRITFTRYRGIMSPWGSAKDETDVRGWLVNLHCLSY